MSGKGRRFVDGPFNADVHTAGSRDRTDALIEALELLREADLLHMCDAEAREHRRRASDLVAEHVDANAPMDLRVALGLLHGAELVSVPDLAGRDMRRRARRLLERTIGPDLVASLTTFSDDEAEA